MRLALSELIERDNVETKFVMKGNGPEDWPNANAYVVTLRRNGKELTTPFYTDEANTDDPDADSVLGSLLSDSTAVDQSFEEWASEFDLDPDSRKAYATWEACRASGEKVRAFLGEAYEEYLHSEH